MIDAKARTGKTEPVYPTPVLQEILERADSRMLTGFSRVEKRGVLPCKFGAGGTCCHVCNMGPCQIVEGVEGLEGICGASGATVAARNFARMVAGGTSAHSEHGKHVAEVFAHVVNNQEISFEVRDKRKLKVLAQEFGLDPEQDEPALLQELAKTSLKMFDLHTQEGCLSRRAPKPTFERWEKHGIVPQSINKEVVELIHRTTIGVDQDYKNLLLGAAKCSLADGWGGSMLATELQDLLLGTPDPIKAVVNVGPKVVRKDMVNVAIHGHDPLLADVLIRMSKDPEVLARAAQVGAKGVNLLGVCCTGNEVLMRYGLPVAASFVHQEAAIATGALEAMVVDVQCIIQNITRIASFYHTEIITTTDISKIEGATHISFRPEQGEQIAKEILFRAIDRFALRDKNKINIPAKSLEIVAGFSHETIMYVLGGRFRASYRPLNDNIVNGKIRGLAAIVGCDNFRSNADLHVEIAKELIANDVLVLTTGCSAVRMAMEGLLSPEAASMAGSGLREVLEAIGCPPVLHMGSCVDNSRILIAATEMVNTGAPWKEIAQIPAVGAAPEWMSEKAIAIGMYFVASGVQVVFSEPFPVQGSKKAYKFLTEEIEDYFGASWKTATTSNQFVNMMVDRINFGRKGVGIDQPRPRILFDMSMRRTLDQNRYISPFHGLGCFGPHLKYTQVKQSA